MAAIKDGDKDKLFIDKQAKVPSQAWHKRYNATQESDLVDKLAEGLKTEIGWLPISEETSTVATPRRDKEKGPSKDPGSELEDDEGEAEAGGALEADTPGNVY